MNKIIVINTYSTSEEEQKRIEDAAKVANDVVVYEFNNDKKCCFEVYRNYEFICETKEEIALRCTTCNECSCVFIQKQLETFSFNIEEFRETVSKNFKEEYEGGNRTFIETEEDMRVIEESIKIIKEFRKIFTGPIDPEVVKEIEVLTKKLNK